MYLVSRYGGWGRGIRTSIDNGTIDVRDRSNRVNAKVRNGIVIEETTRKKNECTILRYGRDLTVKNGRKIIRQEFYDSDSLRAMKKGGLWKRQSDVSLCGSKGTLECFSTYNGACKKEVFTYSNGIRGYCAARWQKKLTVYRPDGKRWMVVKGKVHVSQYPIFEHIQKNNGDFDIWRFMNGRNWEMTIYDADGTTVITHGFFKEGQKEAKWLENTRVRYYMAGVKVSQSLYEQAPDSWNPHEVLNIPNAQLRCSLLNRLGYDKLLAKVKSKVLDNSYDGGQLIEVTANSSKKVDDSPDKIMHLIKVICPSTGQAYVLRVPPEIKKFEQARQWTFGLRQENIRNGEFLNLAKET